MTINRSCGFALLMVGAVLMLIGFRSMNAPMEQLWETVPGRYGNETMWYFVAGIAVAVGGGMLATFGNRK